MEKRKSLSEVHSSVKVPEKRGFFKTMAAFFGPAYLVSVGYMDPGNWATDIAGGSEFGYKLIFVLLLSNLAALLLQSLSARLGIVRGLDLAQASRENYSPFVNFILYILAEIAIAACDLAEVIGMAIGINLLFGIGIQWAIIITVLDTFLLLFLLNKGVRKMEAFILALVFIIGVSFLVELIIVKPEIGEIAKGFIPTELSGSALYIAIGIIGATVMPHNLYLHSSLVQTRKIKDDSYGIKRALKFNFIDTTVALNLAFFVNAGILILAASAFHKNGYYEIAEIQDAHKMLTHIFGNLAPALFAIALIAAGQSSTVTGTLAGQIVMEGYLHLRIAPWLRRILTRLLAIVPAIITINILGENHLGELLILSQVILSIQLGFAIIPLIHLVSDKQKMKGYHIPGWVKVLSWICASVIIFLNIKLVFDSLKDWLHQDNSWYVWLTISVALFIGFLLIYIIVSPLTKKIKSAVIKPPHGKAQMLPDLKSIRFTKIAVTIDFSNADAKAIQMAVSQGKHEASYVLIHIVESVSARYSGSQTYDVESKQDRKNLDDYKNQLLELGYKAEIQLGYGKPAKEIARIAKETRSDLLVMGTHGHHSLKDLIFGTTVESVRHQIEIPMVLA